MDLKHLSTKQKILLFGGAGVVVLFLVKSVSKGSTSAAGTSAQADATGQMANMMQQFMQAQAQQNQQLVAGMQQSQPDVTGALNQTVTQLLSAQQQSTGETLSAMQQNQQQTMSAMANLFSQHQTSSQQQLTNPFVVGKGAGASNVYRLGNATTAQETNLASQPQTNVVRMPNGSVVVAKGGSSYNNAVNAAGGQWINHQWYAGDYQNGKFVTKNKAQQAVYNRVAHVK